MTEERRPSWGRTAAAALVFAAWVLQNFMFGESGWSLHSVWGFIITAGFGVWLASEVSLLVRNKPDQKSQDLS